MAFVWVLLDGGVDYDVGSFASLLFEYPWLCFFIYLFTIFFNAKNRLEPV